MSRHRGAWRNWLSHWQLALPTGLAIVLVALLCWLQLLQPLEQLAYQGLFRSRGPLAWDDRVVLVKIDDASLQQLGTFPWSRDRYTQLLNLLQTATPNVVVFDLIFVESSGADAAFADALRAHQSGVIASGGGRDSAVGAPNSQLANAAIGVGHVRHIPDQDGLVRRVPAVVDQLPSLSLLGLQSYRLFAAAPPIPVQPQLWPNWIGPIDQMPQYAFSDVLNGRVNPTALQNKIILVGVTAAGFNPLVTPFDRSPPASGVHLQATLLNNLLQQNLLQPLSGWGWWGLLLLSNGLWGYMLYRWRMAAQLLGLGLLSGSWWMLCGLALRQHYWLPVLLPIGLWLTTIVLHWMLLNRRLELKNQRLTRLANLDELTQVANRRAFEQYLQQEWQRSRREQQPISLILCDVDFFKQFNDYYGHLLGDHVLYQVAQALSASTKRPTDLIARYGGEEFAVILPNTSEAGACQLTARILSELRAQLIPHAGSAVSHYLTLSLGSATIVPTGELDWHRLIDAADRGLYQAKSQGRDRACHSVMVGHQTNAPLATKIT
jgi:adenylate cyclase